MKSSKVKTRRRHQRAFYNHDNRESHNALYTQGVIVPEINTKTCARRVNAKLGRVVTKPDEYASEPELSVQLKLNFGEER